MKKLFTLFSAIAISLCMMTFVSCSDDEDTDGDTIVGTWTTQIKEPGGMVLKMTLTFEKTNEYTFERLYQLDGKTQLKNVIQGKYEVGASSIKCQRVKQLDYYYCYGYIDPSVNTYDENAVGTYQYHLSGNTLSFDDFLNDLSYIDDGWFTLKPWQMGKLSLTRQ